MINVDDYDWSDGSGVEDDRGTVLIDGWDDPKVVRLCDYHRRVDDVRYDPDLLPVNHSALVIILPVVRIDRHVA